MSHKDVLIVFGVFTAIGYLVITIFIPIPTFIKYENILYSTLYILFTYIAIKFSKVPLISLIFFNVGRISRSIITPYGEIAEMAREHMPLLLFLVLYGLYVSYLIWRENR